MFQFTIYNLCMLNEPDFSNLENYPTKNLAQFNKKKKKKSDILCFNCFQKSWLT